MSTSDGRSYPKGTASTCQCHDVSMTQVGETPSGVSLIFTELVLKRPRFNDEMSDDDTEYEPIIFE